MSKIKVVLICHFSTKDIRGNLKLDNRRLYAFLRGVLRMSEKNNSYGDIAPWVTYIIDNLSRRSDLELHVISAHTGLKGFTSSFQINKVNYYFVKADYTTFLKRLIKNDKLWRMLNPMRFVVKKIVNKISPDVVNLIGAENAYISGTILNIHNFPIYVLCQTIYNNPNRSLYGQVDSKNATTESLIFQKEQYFAVHGKMHYDLLISMKPNAIIFDWKPFSPLPEVEIVSNKQFDFVNFAMELSSKKGFHDSIKALAEVKHKYPKVKLNIVGGSDSSVKSELLNLIDSLGLQNNVVFTPFFAAQEDLFQHLQYSRFAVLPCKMDNIAGTMLQAMHYGLPLVVYETSGTPLLNEEKETVLIAENSNVSCLAKKMLELLDNPHKARQLQKHAVEYSAKYSNNNEIVDRLISQYRAIINHYYHNIPIPKDLYFIPNQ